MKREFKQYHLYADGKRVRELSKEEYWRQTQLNQKRKHGWLLANTDLEDNYLYVSDGQSSLILDIRQLKQTLEL